MDDLLNKIRQTEDEAKQIIADAEAKSHQIMNDANIAASNDAEEQRKHIYEKLIAERDAKYNEMMQKRDVQIREKTEQYKKSFGDIEAKKSQCVAAVEKFITESI